MYVGGRVHANLYHRFTNSRYSECDVLQRYVCFISYERGCEVTEQTGNRESACGRKMAFSHAYSYLYLSISKSFRANNPDVWTDYSASVNGLTR